MKNTAIKQAAKPFAMPEEQYRAIDAVSSTDLRMLSVNPRKLWLYKQGKAPVSNAMLEGTMFHCAILEPEKFMDLYVVEPDSLPDGTVAGVGEGKINRNTKIWKDFISQWRDKNQARIQVSPDEFNVLRKMMTAVHSNKVANELLKTHEKELVALWNDPETGEKCKGRADLIGHSLVDFKSTTCESPREFENECYRRSVHSQLAFYDTGFSLNGCEFSSHFVIGVEKSKEKSETSCFVMQVEENLLERGRERNKRLMDLYQKCKQKNDWPGFESVYSLGIPSWALVDLEGE